MVLSTFLICENYGESHAINTCGINPKVVNYIHNQNHQGNSYSNTYNLGWINYPNFSWGNNQGGKPPNRPPFNPLGFNQSQQQPPLMKEPRLGKFEGLLESILFNVVPRMDTKKY